MKRLRRTVLAASLVCLAVGARAQVDPTAPVSNTMPQTGYGFNLPTHLGTLSYALSGSEVLNAGFGGGGVYASTVLSGDMAYLSSSPSAPTSVIYTGGLDFSGLPGTSRATVFQSVAASQVYQTKSWVFVASDSFAYLPTAPTTGLSGVAGIGDVGVFPVQTGIGPTQAILTNYSSQISNGVQGSASWQMSPSLSLEGSGSWQLLHFVGGAPGLDSNQTGATFGPNYRIDARNSVGADAFYYRQTYPTYGNYVIETEGVTANFTRAWTRRLSTTFNLGPARTHGVTYAVIPQKWDLQGSAQASYSTRTTAFYAAYTRAVNAGSGIIFGGRTDGLSAGMNRPIDRNWAMSLQVSYSHTVGLTPLNNAIPRYNSTFGAVQVTHRLTDTLSAYGSYTGMGQSANNPSPLVGAAFNGINHILAVGITFAPAPLLRGR